MSDNTISRRDISVTLAQHGLQINPQGADAIQNADAPDAVLDALTEEFDSGTIAPEDVEAVVNSHATAETTDDAGDEDESATSSEQDNSTDSESDKTTQDGDAGEPEETETTQTTADEDTDRPEKTGPGGDVESDEGTRSSGVNTPEQQDTASDGGNDGDASEDTGTGETGTDDESEGDAEDEASDEEESNDADDEADDDDAEEGEGDDGEVVTGSEKDHMDVDEATLEDKYDDDTAHGRWPEPATRLLEEITSEVAERETDQREIEVKKDITGESRCTGVYEDFSALFRDRYQRVSDLLRSRIAPSPIESLSDPRRGGSDVSVIGMVRDTWTSRNGNQMLEVEDTTGSMRVVFTDEEVEDDVNQIIDDEIVGVAGQLSDDCGIIFGNEVLFPDIPPRASHNAAERPVKAAFISDIHFGADTFAYDKWRQFVNWIRTQDDIEYLFVGGDFVEGIGVYPGQDEELSVMDIYDQYELLAESFKQLPSSLDIITTVGNHDPVRLAEPQPTLKDAYQEFFPDNVRFVGNPSLVEVEGVNVLMYHGMSIHAIAEQIPGIDADEPTGPMQKMLEKRHLAPMYGSNVRLAPEEDDHMVIEEVPDILHCGHVHQYDQETYNGVLMMNTACWQYQTDFQKQKDIQPDVGYAPVVNLKTMDVDVKTF